MYSRPDGVAEAHVLQESGWRSAMPALSVLLSFSRL